MLSLNFIFKYFGIMSELLKKISSYYLFNYFLPGAILVFFLNDQTPYIIQTDNLFILAFVTYFVGLVVSRVWSVIVEPLFKKLKIIEFRKYLDFITASKQDEKIEVLSEQNNMYRTIISMLLIIWWLKSYILISEHRKLWKYNIYILIVLLLMLFIFAYRKQTKYIVSRIDKVIK